MLDTAEREQNKREVEEYGCDDRTIKNHQADALVVGLNS
jgi:hypothetical protein